MAAVQQRVLNWLYSVLTSEYHDVNRVYNDTAQVLSNYSSLSPKTDVYTYENGTSVLLLNLSGTIPAAFRGMTYNFPISLWIPHAYPREAPMVYVTPTEGMVVRAGQHVDPQGKVYHPYLAAWPEFWDRYNVITFIAILRDVFAKEPPVIARQQQNEPQRHASIPPPRPPLPPNINGSPVPTPASSAGPPPPPPKPSQNAPERAESPSSYSQPRENQGPPPLPPLPPQLRGASPQNSPNLQRSSIYGQVTQPQRPSSLRYENPPPLPQPIRQQSLQDPSSRSPNQESYGRQYQQPPQNHTGNQYTGPPQPPPGYANPAQQYTNQPTQFRQPPQQAQPPPPQQKPPPPPDLLDAPLTLLQPPDQSHLPAPPIPPNPEKDALLQTLARTLHSNRAQNTNLTNTTIPSLAAQNRAMLTAFQSMQAEMEALTNLSNSLTSNTQILHNSLQVADDTILSSKSQKAPSIDDILVAPTTVANQLYDLICEERALGDTLFVLGRAVERGRISGPTFVKMTRALARECFLKKALIKKIAKGMGLESGN